MKNHGVTIIIPCKDLTGGNKQIIRSTYYSLYNARLSLDSGPNPELVLTPRVCVFGGRVTIENGLYRDALLAG